MLITKSEFARRMKVSPQAVAKAVRSGRLTLIAGKLDEKVAALQWDANRLRPPPPPPGSRPTTNQQPCSIDWLVENTALWITMLWNREALPNAARNWLELATGGPVNPELQARFVALLREFATCAGRLENPEPDEEPDADAQTGNVNL